MEDWQRRYVRDVVNALGRPKWPKEDKEKLVTLLRSVTVAVANKSRKVPNPSLIVAETVRVLTQVDVFDFVPKPVSGPVGDLLNPSELSNGDNLVIDGRPWVVSGNVVKVPGIDVWVIKLLALDEQQPEYQELKVSLTATFLKVDPTKG